MLVGFQFGSRARWVVRCDHCGREHRAERLHGDESRRIAEADGWQSGGSGRTAYDLCPKCAPGKTACPAGNRSGEGGGHAPSQ